MPGAGRIRGATDGGPLKGGAPRAVWQALGADPRTVSARSAAQRLAQLGRASHLVWNPVHGEIVQLIPILRAGRSLGGPAASGIAEVNAEGRVCAQICVVAFALDPLTSLVMNGQRQILDWLDSWGIPQRWPAGHPVPVPVGHAGSRDRRLWAKGGHFVGSFQVPDVADAGSGAPDTGQVTGWTGAAGPRAARLPLPGDGVLAAASGMRELDHYVDGDAAATAGRLSRVG
jgi:hypothetical protein